MSHLLPNKVLLVVLDGVGINPNSPKNALITAQTPTLDRLFNDYPMALLDAGGEKVGLPKGVIGNSEVGHMNLGAGRPVRQDLVRINEAIENKTLGTMPEFKQLIHAAQKNTGRIHLMGLLSDGGVHSHISHLKEIVELLGKESGLQLFLHAFLDGRDTAKDVGTRYLEDIETISHLKIASIQGRSIAMDRDRRWEKIELAYQTMIGKGNKTNLTPIDYVKSEYQRGIFDEFITPVLINEEGAIKQGDALFFFNFRPDRAIQLSLAFNDPNFQEFDRPLIPPYFLCMTPYINEEVELPILFDKEKISGGLSEYLSLKGRRQFKIAETEKYAHVTYFFNGGERTPFPGETQKLIPSPREVKTYDEKPEMSAYEVTRELKKAISEKAYDFLLVNYANCDMVGHTGDFEAAVKAAEAVDDCLGQVLQLVEEQGDYTAIITADHGNCDEMAYPNGQAHTSHSAAPVPFIFYHPSLKGKKLEQAVQGPALMDVAPTVLNLMQIELPSQFSGKPIFKLT